MRCSKKDMGTGLVAFERFVANHSRSLKDQRRVKTVEILAEVGIDEVWIRTTINSKGAGYALEALGINVLTTGAIILSELLQHQGTAMGSPWSLRAYPQGRHDPSSLIPTKKRSSCRDTLEQVMPW